MKKYLVITLTLSILVQFVFAQSPNRRREAGSPPPNVVNGIVIDAVSGSPLDYATVSIYRGDRLITGTITDEQGIFKLRTRPGTFNIVVEFLAYASIRMENVEVTPANKIIDLGQIKLSPDANLMDEIEVVGEQSQVQLSLDKKIYNVGKDINSRGGAADDVLSNLPSVNVDLDGNVSLRGSENVRILIDGRPSGASGISGVNILKSIQANQIERVEVITNPSARYEAEGTAGIINIVLKKNNKSGLNGSFDVSTGIPALAGLGINLNYRKGKINWFTSVGARYRTSDGSGFRHRFFTDGREPNSDSQTRVMDRSGLSYNLKLGMTYFLNPKNTITTSFSGNMADEDNQTVLTYREFDINKNLTDIDIRTDDESEDEKRLQYNLNYTHTFDSEKHILTTDFTYTNFSETEFSGFSEQAFDLSMNPDGSPQQQRNFIDEGEKVYIIKSDYNYPIKEEGKIELGYRGSFRDVTNEFQVDTLIDDAFEVMPEFKNNLLYNEIIHAAYATIGNKINNFSFLAGIRMEYSDIETSLLFTGEKNPRSYTDFFPSLFLTYNLTEQHAVQTSYSRRVRRPRFFELNPFITFSDNRNLFQGNPDLNPEYSDSYELGYIAYLEKITATTSIYYRHTEGAIQRIVTANPDRSSTIIPQNIGIDNAYGLEITVSSDLSPWWKINGDINLFRFYLQGQFDDQVFNVQDITYRGRVNNKFNIAKSYDVQLSANYRAGSKTAQGSRQSVISVDLGASTDLLQDKATLSINVRDVFNSRKRRSRTIGENFVFDGEFQWRSRQLNLSFNYRLNQRKSRNGGSYRNGSGGNSEF